MLKQKGSTVDFKTAEVGDEFYHVYKHSVFGYPQVVAHYKVSQVDNGIVVSTLVLSSADSVDDIAQDTLQCTHDYVATDTYTDFADVRPVLSEIRLINKRLEAHDYMGKHILNIPEELCDAILSLKLDPEMDKPSGTAPNRTRRTIRS